MPLTLSTYDAANLTQALSKTVDIDNEAPSVTLSGPTDSPSWAGTQYVSASATAGPSGVAGISCAVDGGAGHWYPGASARVPVNGIGEHSVQCRAADNAVDPAGVHGWSAPMTWSMKIGEPTISGISFTKIVDALRCRRVQVTVHRHGPKGHARRTTITRCHPRTKVERVKVRVKVRRHGRTLWVTRIKRRRVVIGPRVVGSTTRRVAHGKATTVSGWLGTSSGVALGHQTVEVLTAPDDGLDRFSPAATVTTAANGGWTARLRAGPSRLVEAVYGGGPTTEASSSGEAHLLVPAEVRLLSVTPRRIPWGGTVRITGQLVGGYLPAGGALVRLRIGIGSVYQTYGVQSHVTGNGRFTTAYTFGAGDAALHRAYFFQIATLPMGDYPYAAAASGRRTVLVGGHPRARRQPP